MDLKRHLTQKERDELESLMEARDPHFTGPMQGSITRVHGFLTSIVSGPIVPPSQWVPMVFADDGDHPWETAEQAQRAMGLLMRLNNEIASDLLGGGRRYSILIDRLGDPPDTLDLADDWCKGYTLAFALREDEWQEAMDAPELREAFQPILAIARPKTSPELDPVENPEAYAATVDRLPDCATQIYDWWRKKLFASPPPAPDRRTASSTIRRAGPKISPNAFCPCGSGKKYKRCCSALRIV